jgi:Cu-Zn family superoxide dismutase
MPTQNNHRPNSKPEIPNRIPEHRPPKPQSQGAFERFAERILMGRPNAIANIKGSHKYPNIRGKVEFRKAGGGTLVSARIYGLPSHRGGNAVFAFHIHEGGSCTGTIAEPFSNAGEHYNPTRAEHPYHAGDLPELFAQNGFALANFYTERFVPRQVTGRTVIIHEHSEEHRGGFGEKIACGVIVN